MRRLHAQTSVGPKAGATAPKADADAGDHERSFVLFASARLVVPIVTGVSRVISLCMWTGTCIIAVREQLRASSLLVRVRLSLLSICTMDLLPACELL
jgi:hypothetical protein